MIDLTLLSGPERGRVYRVGSLPACIGRGAKADLQITGPGVWDTHFELGRADDSRVTLTALGDARVAVDSAPVREAVLANGSLLDVGGITLRFSISGAPQRPQALRESMVWVGAVVLMIAQVFLIWWTGR